MNGNSGGIADQAVDAALRYRSQAPLIDALLAELGLKGGSLNGLVSPAGGAGARYRRERRGRGGGEAYRPQKEGPPKRAFQTADESSPPRGSRAEPLRASAPATMKPSAPTPAASNGRAAGTGTGATSSRSPVPFSVKNFPTCRCADRHQQGQGSPPPTASMVPLNMIPYTVVTKVREAEEPVGPNVVCRPTTQIDGRVQELVQAQSQSPRQPRRARRAYRWSRCTAQDPPCQPGSGHY